MSNNAIKVIHERDWFDPTRVNFNVDEQVRNRYGVFHSYQVPPELLGVSIRMAARLGCLKASLPEPAFGAWELENPLVLEAVSVEPHNDPGRIAVINATLTGERVVDVDGVPYLQRPGDLLVINGILRETGSKVVSCELPEHSVEVISEEPAYFVHSGIHNMQFIRSALPN